MTGHLARLAVRAARPSAGGLRPRVPALFELPSGVPGVGPSVDLRPVEEHGGAPPGDVPRSVSGPPLVGPTGSPEVVGARGAGEPDAAQEPAREPRRSPDQRAPSRSPARAPDAVPPAAATSSLDEFAPGSPTPSIRSPSPRSTTAERVVASLVAEAVTAGLRPPAGRTQQRPADGTGETPSAATPTGGPPTAAPLPAAPLPAARLPRLQAPGQDARRDRPSAAPQVSVTIGRIEVVPPVPQPPARHERPRPRARASGAPPLADYLRDRSRR